MTAVTFSYMQGTIHPYYTVALAPAIAALAGTGGAALWQRRGDHGRTAWAVLALVVAVTAAWDIALLRSQSSFHPSVTVVVIVVAVLALASLVAAAARTRACRRAAAVAGITTILATAVPVASWGVATAATAHSGSIPTAVVTGNRTGTGGGFGGGGVPGGAQAGGTRTGGTQPGGTRTGRRSGRRDPAWRDPARRDQARRRDVRREGRHRDPAAAARPCARAPGRPATSAAAPGAAR